MERDPAPFVLASLLTSYPMEFIPECVPIILQDIGTKIPDDLRALILERTSEKNLQDLQSEYIALFDNGRTSNPVYETEYDRRRAMAKGAELADIAGFYKAFNFEIDISLDGMEMLDHVGVELEFHALMLMKEQHLTEANDALGAEIVGRAIRGFLKAHLGRFVGAIARRPGVRNSGFYGPVFMWCSRLVDDECRRMNLEIVPADWVDGPSVNEDEMNCKVGGTCPA